MEDLLEVVSEMDDHLEQEVDPELDQIQRWRDIIAARANSTKEKKA